MKFPSKKYKKIEFFTKDYFDEFLKAKSSINFKDLDNVFRVLYKLYKNNKTIFVCGNGGSAAIANHFECDHKKILFENTKIKPRIILHYFGINIMGMKLTSHTNKLLPFIKIHPIVLEKNMQIMFII